jgi:mRNA-degrading endonuclease RelE of RelBE toxin-antitoxin system
MPMASCRQVFGGYVKPCLKTTGLILGGVYRVDSGEYRIVYCFDPNADLVEVILVGKRNDDEVYKQLKRLLG